MWRTARGSLVIPTKSLRRASLAREVQPTPLYEPCWLSPRSWVCPWLPFSQTIRLTYETDERCVRTNSSRNRTAAIDISGICPCGTRDLRKYGLVDYDLNRLGSLEFEHMVQALSAAELGVSVSIFGVGSDGGREATFEATGASVAGTTAGWTGYGIVQAKTIRFNDDTAKNASAIVSATRAELNKFVSQHSKKPERANPPQNYIIATNARLSPGPGGGVDQVLEELRSHRVGLSGYTVWHYEHICRLLDVHHGVRRAYAGFITPGDVLHRLIDVLGESSARVGEVLKKHAATQLAAKEVLKLETTEVSDSNKVRLSEIAIDLPAHVSTISEERVVAHILEAGNRSLRESHRLDQPYGFVILGGPGQGKSTLAQIIAQAYRVGLLNETSRPITPDIDAAVRDTQACLSDLGLSVPLNRRWPVVVDLATFADALMENTNLTAIEYIAKQLRVQGANLDAGRVAGWLSSWPWLLILDGLDEVPARESREAVVEALNDLIVESRLGDWDLMVVCTTRPQGYNDEFSELAPQQLELRPLSAEEGVSYARRIVRAKYLNDPETATRVLEDLERAVAQEHTTRLMRSPLQVTIMEFLVEKLASVPDTRHELFDGYYRAIYGRETRKAGYLGTLLRRQSGPVDWVHEQIALLLQKTAERSGEADVSVPESHVVDLFERHLRDLEFDESEIARLSKDLDRAAKLRLVLLVAQTSGNLSFEVRPLQEYMAARALATGPTPEALDRLDVIAPASHWRNTWLLAMGRLYTSRPHERDALLERVRRLNSSSATAAFIGYGSRLAIDLLEDDFASAVPVHRRSLLELAMSQITRWPGPEMRKLAQIAIAALDGADKRSAELVRDALSDAWSGNPRHKVGALSLLRDMTRGSGAASRYAQGLLRSDTGWQPESHHRRVYPEVTVATTLQPLVNSAGLTPDEMGAWTELANGFLSRTNVRKGISLAESVTFSRARLPWTMTSNERRLLEGELTKSAVAKVCNRARVAEMPAAIGLRRVLIGVDQGMQRGHLEPMGEYGVAAPSAVKVRPQG